MMVKGFILLLLTIIALPVMAEQQSLSPIEVEALPFDNSLVAEPNTQSLSIETMNAITPGAGAEHAEKTKAGLPQFDVTTFSSQLFWLFVTFVVLYVYFAKAALPKLSSALEKRRDTIQADLEQAEKISVDVDKTRADYEAAMQKAHDDARQTITDVEQHLRNDADAQVNAFKEKSEKAVSDLEAKAEKAKAKIKSELNDIAANLTSDIIAKLTPLSVKDADIQKAVSKYSDNTSSTPKKKAA